MKNDLEFMGIPFFVGDRDDLKAVLEKREICSIEFANTHTTVLSNTDSHFKKVYSNFDFILADGVPLYWSLKVLFNKNISLIRGPDFFKETFLSENGLRHFIVGGNESSIELLRFKLKNACPNSELVGYDLSVFDLNSMEWTQKVCKLADQINELRVNFIWVGLGTPKQQIVISELRKKIIRGNLCSIGFALNTVAGLERDPPRWIIHLGLGWAFRLLQDPWRLAKRYVIFNFLYIVLLLREVFLNFIKKIYR